MACLMSFSDTLQKCDASGVRSWSDQDARPRHDSLQTRWADFEAQGLSQSIEAPVKPIVNPETKECSQTCPNATASVVCFALGAFWSI